jgi:hypothetical protein
MMLLALIFAAAVAVDGPDLAAIDRAVLKCDAKAMTATFADEPQRRRTFAISVFNEQQAIVNDRRLLAARRMTQPSGIAAIPVATPVGASDEPGDIDRQAYLLGERQRELDDVRMLSTMRDQVLDLMRQQYLTKCAVGRQP